MAIDSFWWILALISDQTMYEALKENEFISSLTLTKIWICSFLIMSTYNSCQFCANTICVVLAYQTTVYLKSEQICVIARMIGSFWRHSVNFDGKVLNFSLYVFGRGWVVHLWERWPLEILIVFFFSI